MRVALLATVVMNIAQAPAPLHHFDSFLVCPMKATRQRTPITVDPLQGRLVRGETLNPVAGEPAWEKGPPWAAVVVDPDGSVADPALDGGYAWATFCSPAEGVAMLDAQGATCILVNGTPRVGDMYSTGAISVPVSLKRGVNSFLFVCNRGKLSAQLREPESPTPWLDTRDLTLPDLVVGEPTDACLGLVVVNPTDRRLTGAQVTLAMPDGGQTSTRLPVIEPLSVHKACVRLRTVPPTASGPLDISARLIGPGLPTPAPSATIPLRVVESHEKRLESFVSQIDGSCQHYAVVPATTAAKAAESPATRPGLLLSLHGASVAAMNQANCYAPRDWCTIICPTNRRPYGFSWEAWGRIDALEAMDTAKLRHHTDPLRQWLTGHSMGGHGTWSVGAHLCDRFAAIAPSAGWISFWTYGGAAGQPAAVPSDGIAFIMEQAANATRPLLMKDNYAAQGVFVLHGSADDNVPVSEARAMRAQLGAFHPDFVYHEQPGAGHWWGDQCVDWPPLMEFLRTHSLPNPDTVEQVRFTTISPDINATVGFATIAQQLRALEPSSVDLRIDPPARSISGTTSNVALLGLEADLDGDSADLTVVLDGQTIKCPEPDGGDLLWLRRDGDTWRIGEEPGRSEKRPGRSGPFQSAFDRNVVLVYGTAGTAEETLWARDKARFDSESFWMRGNGSFEVLSDVAYLEARASGGMPRNAVLYGHAEMNSAWKELLPDSPIEVRRGEVRVGDRVLSGENTAAVFVRPIAETDCLVGVVAGTGPTGLRLCNRMPLFASGVHYPDLMVADVSMLEQGSRGLRGAGSFANDWTLHGAQLQFQGDWQTDPALSGSP